MQGNPRNCQGLKWPRAYAAKAPEITTASQEKGDLLIAQEHDVVLHSTRIHLRASYLPLVGKKKIIRSSPAKVSGQERM